MEMISRRVATGRQRRRIHGIDFTSAPRRAKAITIATGDFDDAILRFTGLLRLNDFASFEAWLGESDEWIVAFDFPFGLPRELCETLGWPLVWRALTQHVRSIGKDAFKAALNEVRVARPVGSKYIARRGDAAAGSSSPMKLVNPPVGLMFFEGALRLADAGVSIFPCAPNADRRIALEGYPGYLARQLTSDSYKKEGAEGNTPKRVAARRAIMRSLGSFCRSSYGFGVEVSDALLDASVSDGSGDTLDALLCCVQATVASVAYKNGDLRYGIPQCADDFEGWIVTVPST
jgi:Protein of unknown function (DUF429)